MVSEHSRTFLSVIPRAIFSLSKIVGFEIGEFYMVLILIMIFIRLHSRETIIILKR